MLTKILDRIKELENTLGTVNSELSPATEQLMRDTLRSLRNLVLTDSFINLDGNPERDDFWLVGASAENDNRPVLTQIAYSDGYSVASDGYRLHVVPGKTKWSKEDEEIKEEYGTFPKWQAMWNGTMNYPTVIAIDPKYLVDAVEGLIDFDHRKGLHIYLAVNRSGDPIALWNPRTDKRAMFMPMSKFDVDVSKVSVPQLGEPSIPVEPVSEDEDVL